MLKRWSRFLTGVVLGVPLFVGCSGEKPAGPQPASEQAPITGGVDDTGTAAHPWVVFLLNPGGGCSGTLLAPKLVLTARHCVAQNVTQGIGCDVYGASSNGDHVSGDYAASSITVYTGQNPNLGSPVAAGAQLFHPPGNNLCNNDLSLIVLNKAITTVTPAKIRLDWGPQIGELTTAVGYGAVNDNQFGAGVRRRRDNVPVITAGQDWNQVTGAGEVAMGQAVCSGDSGGPVFSQAGGQIGIASRVTQCTDPNATAKYVRLDYHKNLILQAFAAAGASPSLEPGSAPPPPVIKQIGEGPCSTGSQCSSWLCDTTNGNYCTAFCASGTTCPTGMFCADNTIVISGQSITDKMCIPIGGTGQCDQCQNAQCVNVVSSCLNNAECKAALDCAKTCGDSACVDVCGAQHPSGAEDFDLLKYCTCQSCAAECAAQCTAPTTGGGGGGGAGGFGGGAGGFGATAGSGNVGNKPGFGGVDGGKLDAGKGDGGPQPLKGHKSGCAMQSGGSEPPWALLLGLLVFLRARRERAEEDA